MRTILILAAFSLLACQSETVEEPGAEGEEGTAGPAAEVEDVGPDGGGPDRDAPITARLEGTLVYEEFTGGMLQVDVVAEKGGSPQVVGMDRYEQPGAFRIAVRGEFDSVALVVYVDADGDGPSAGDLRVEYSGNPISLVDTEVVEGLVVDLSQAEVQDGKPKDAELEEEGAEGAEGAEGDPSSSQEASPDEAAVPGPEAGEPGEEAVPEEPAPE